MNNILKTIVLGLVILLALMGCKKDRAKRDQAEAKIEDSMLKVVYMVNGNLGDLSFFDSANNGMKMLKEKYGDKIETKVVEASTDITKWEPTLEDLSDQDWDIIIVGTWNMVELLEKVAPTYPDKRYIIFDTVMDYSLGTLDNVYSMVYKQNEAAFLAGALAAKITTSDDSMVNPDKKIGFLGGIDMPVINDFLVGYIQGAQYIDTTIEVLVSYIGSFNDSAKGKEIALVQYNQGADIGFNVAGSAGLGQLDAAKQANKYVIGVDTDQAALFKDSDPIKSKLIITSALKRIDNSIVRSIDKHLDGSLRYGTSETLGFAENAVGIAENEYYEDIVPEEIRQEISDIKAKIIAKEIHVDTAFGMSADQLNAIKNSTRQ